MSVICVCHTSPHLHILHLPIYIITYSHLHTHTHTSLHLHILTSSLLSLSHTHIFTHIFTYSHLLFLSLALTSSHTHIFSLSLSSFLSLSPFSLPFLSLAFFIFLSLGRGWCRRGVTKRQPFRTKWGSMRKNRGKIAILLVPDLSRSNPFARNEGRCAKTEVKLRFFLCRTCPGATLSHEMRVDAQKLS